MKPHHRLCISAFLFVLGASLPALAQDKTYRLMTMEFAPYNYTAADGRFSGICTDIVREILGRVGHPEDFKIFPLVRAYKMLEREDDLILFSRLRTPKREKQNKWVGPLMPFRLVIYAKKDSDIRIPDIESAKKYRVGCSRGSGGHRLLLKHGFPQIDDLANGTRNSLKLERGRIDLWLTSDLVGKYGSKVNHVDSKQFEIVYEFQPVHSLHIAFSNNIPDELVAKWQKALDDVKSEGLYDRIIERYLRQLGM